MLVVRVTVNGGHRPLEYANRFVEHLHHRRQAIGGARCVRDHIVLGRIVCPVVDSQHDGDIFVRGRSGDDDLLHAAANVLAGFLGIRESSRGFDHDLRAHRVPVELRGILLGKDFNALAAYMNDIAFGPDLFRQSAQHGVVLEQMRQRLGIRQIVDGHEFDVVAMQGRPDHVPADAAETVDAYFYSHFFS